MTLPSERYVVWIDDKRGNRLHMVAGILNLTAVRVANDFGSVQISLPGDIDRDLLRVDGFLEVWRAAEGGPLLPEAVCMMRDFDSGTDRDGFRYVTVSGPDQNYLLDKAIIAYPAASPQSAKSGKIDDVMKAVVRENLGPGALPERDLSGVGFSVDGDVSLGPDLSKSFAWRNVLVVLQDLQRASKEAGTEVHFAVVPQVLTTGLLTFRFETFIDRIGSDLTDQVMFGPMWGNTRTFQRRQVYSNERNYIYVGGGGEEDQREIVEVWDAERIGISPWNRRERFSDASAESTAGLISKGQQVLTEGEPYRRFSVDLLDTPSARYGLDWHFGDVLPVMDDDRLYTGAVNGIKIELGSNEDEVISARLEGDL